MTARLRIFISSTDALCDRMDLLAPDEQQRAHAMPHARRRKQLCAGRALLRLALSEGNNRAPAEWPIRLHDNRPLLDGADAPRFSLSHSGDHVGCAISHEARCGFDLQRHAPRSRHAIANTYFSADDTRWLEQQPDFSSAFHQLWVLKESWAKASGTPLLTALAQACCRPRHTPNAAATHWDAGTTCLSGTLTVGWAADGPVATTDVKEWHDDGFSQRTPCWTRWTLRSESDSPQCAT